MPENISLEKDDLRRFFILHLDNIYAAKTHLLKRLPEMLYQAHFADLEEAIFETIKMVEGQKKRMDTIYMLLDAPVSDGRYSGLAGIVEDSFEEIRRHEHHHELRDMSLLFYLANIEGIEMASFQILQLMAVKLENKEIGRLIKENFDDAHADKTLLLLITSKYLRTIA